QDGRISPVLTPGSHPTAGRCEPKRAVPIVLLARYGRAGHVHAGRRGCHRGGAERGGEANRRVLPPAGRPRPDPPGPLWRCVASISQKGPWVVLALPGTDCALRTETRERNGGSL